MSTITLAPRTLALRPAIVSRVSAAFWDTADVAGRNLRTRGVPVMFLLVFTSCAFVPLSSMPGWLQAIGAHQPINALVTAERALILDGSGVPAAHDALISLAWSAGILLTFAILSARTYARMSR